MAVCLVASPIARGEGATLVRSAKSGAWSAPETWENRHVPAEKDRVQIRTGHAVTYDVGESPIIRSIHVAGSLSFAADRDTRLDVGLIKIQSGEDASENGFDCGPHPVTTSANQPALAVGTVEHPIDATHHALIRLTYIKGMDEHAFPAIVCCGGRMDFHGAPMNRTRPCHAKLFGLAGQPRRHGARSEAERAS